MSCYTNIITASARCTSSRPSKLDCSVCLHHYSDDAVNHRRLDCLHTHMLRRRSKKTSKLRVTGHCGNNRWPADSPSQRTSNAENVSIWWRHPEIEGPAHSARWLAVYVQGSWSYEGSGVQLSSVLSQISRRFGLCFVASAQLCTEFLYKLTYTNI